MITNFLSPIGFIAKINRLPNTELTVQKLMLPEVSLSQVRQPTPFVSLPWSGGMTYGYLQMSFKVAEDMSNYLEIFNWIETMGHPDQLETYEDLRSDASILILNSNKRANLACKLTNCFPIQLAPIEMDCTDPNLTYVEASVTLAFDRIHYSKV